jgi:hypothetical protein
LDKNGKDLHRFEENRQFLVAHANDPGELIKKDRYERMRHYIYLDKYGIFPYPTLPHNYDRFYNQVGRMVVHEINGAARDAGSYW